MMKATEIEVPVNGHYKLHMPGGEIIYVWHLDKIGGAVHVYTDPEHNPIATFMLELKE